MKLYVRLKTVGGKWTYKALDTKETNLAHLVAQEGWTWHDE
tara:strand:+ start:302 stop:424 length:123 start_codon:yes stop_codon:yes gene_type:complete